MTTYSGASEIGLHELVAEQVIALPGVYIYVDFDDRAPKDVGYFYVLTGEGSPPAMSVSKTGIMYAPGTAVHADDIKVSTGNVFSLWINWKVAGLSWYVFA